MGMDAGDAGCTHGLSKRIYDNWTGDASNGFSSPLSGPQAASVKSLCYAVALAVVDEIQANATVTVKTGDAGLQRDNTGGNPDTLGPSGDKTLAGGCIQ